MRSALAFFASRRGWQFLPIRKRSALPTRRCFGLPTFEVTDARPEPRGAAYARDPSSAIADGRTHGGDRTLQGAVIPPGDGQKQRTSPSACARLSSLIAALACSGDWNMVPNRPGTCERLKKVSAAT